MSDLSAKASEIQALKDLHTKLIDSRNGYEEALRQAEGDDHIIVFQELAAAHQTASVEIELRLVALGVTPETSGSLLSTLNQTMMDIRALFTGLGDAVLPALISAEQQNVASYDGAIAGAGADFAPILVASRQTLLDLIGKMERLHARAQA